MKIWNKIIKTALPIVAGLTFTAAANAAVVYPALNIQQLSTSLITDAGIISTASGLTMDATAITIINSDDTVVYDFADQNFFLTSDASGAGTLSVGNDVILTASFSNLTLVDLGDADPFFAGIGNFSADLTYTGGDMTGSIFAGRIEGAFRSATGPIALGNDFTAGSITANIGEVSAVPVPAAVWLFGSALLGLAGIAKRKKTV